jgi:hypothetical protein
MVCVGNTFLIRTPPYFETEHLHIVVSIENNKALLINITSNRSDKTCLLIYPNDHSFLIHDSYINYKDAIVVDICNIEELLSKKMIMPHEDVSGNLLGRIQEGARTSLNFNPEYLTFL